MSNKYFTTTILNERKKVNGFSFSFQTSQSAEKVFKILLDVRSWWTGINGEEP